MLFVVTPQTPYRRMMVNLNLRAAGCELVFSFLHASWCQSTASLRLNARHRFWTRVAHATIQLARSTPSTSQGFSDPINAARAMMSSLCIGATTGFIRSVSGRWRAPVFRSLSCPAISVGERQASGGRGIVMAGINGTCDHSSICAFKGPRPPVY